MESNINLNQCYKGIYNIGSTTYQNICDGTRNVVAWGVMDWLLALVFMAILLFVARMLYQISTDRL
jgi:hypothetical protein